MMKAEITEEIKQSIAIAKNSKRYKDFTYFDKSLYHPVPFNELMEDEYIPIVQVHSLASIGDNITGFCGAFEWKGNTLKALDGDSYNESMLVYGYNWFTTEHGRRGLDVLVREDW